VTRPRTRTPGSPAWPNSGPTRTRRPRRSPRPSPAVNCSSPGDRRSWKPSSSRTPPPAASWPAGCGPAAPSGPIWFRDADVAEAVDAILLLGLAPNSYPPNYDCSACGYATCAEFLHATKTLRAESAELEFTGPTCNLRDIDLGIAVGSAAKAAAIRLDRLPLPNPSSRSPLANSASSPRNSPSRSRSQSLTRRSASTAGCRKSTSTPSTYPRPAPCRSPSRAQSAPAAPATSSNPDTARPAVDLDPRAGQ
jgi:hypothetical protein